MGKSRFKHWEKRRKERVAEVVKEREKVIRLVEQMNRTSGGVGTPGSDEADQNGLPLGIAGPDDSTLLLLEQRRLQRLNERNRKEIMTMMEMEQKMARIQAENEKKSTAEAKRKEEYEKELRKRREEIAKSKVITRATF